MGKHNGRTVVNAIVILLITFGVFIFNFSPDNGAGYITNQFRQSENLRVMSIIGLLIVISTFIIWWPIIFKKR